MQGDVLNTLFALVFAILIVSIIWGLSFYFAEMGSQEGIREAKNIFMGGITLLLLLMCLYAVVEWIRAAIGM
jgi:RsiW-degrading membrane proteinase PrsW (M82 family)